MAACVIQMACKLFHVQAVENKKKENLIRMHDIYINFLVKRIFFVHTETWQIFITCLNRVVRPNRRNLSISRNLIDGKHLRDSFRMKTIFDRVFRTYFLPNLVVKRLTVIGVGKHLFSDMQLSTGWATWPQGIRYRWGQGTTSLADYAEVFRPKIQPPFDGAACLDIFRRFGRPSSSAKFVTCWSI